MPNISIVVTAKAGVEHSSLMLNLLGNSSLKPWEIIFVEQDATDGNRELFAAAGAKIVPAVKPGLAAVWNRGAQSATGELLLFIHNDVLFSPHALQIMADTITERVAAVGPYTNRAYYGWQWIDVGYRDMDSFLRWSVEAEGGFLQPQEDIFVSDFCFMVARKAFAQVGGFNEEFRYSRFLAADYSFRLRLAGYGVMVAPTFVHHNTGSGDALGLVPGAIEEDGLRVFKSIWKFDLAYTTYARTELVDMMKVATAAPQVLEIGCATGRTLLSVKHKYPGAGLYGIELNEMTAKIAATVADVQNIDIERLIAPEWQNKFDAIIAGDVIEHLKNPWQALKNLRRMLKPGGEIILSIPNVAFITNVMKLLNGRWEYEDAGILDRTHLRFFTRESILQMLRETPLESVQLERHFPQVAPALAPQLEDYIARLTALPGLEVEADDFRTYQYYVRAVRAAE